MTSPSNARRPRARWIVALAYLQPDQGSPLIRPRLAVLDRQGSQGVIWIGRENPRSKAAARRVAAHLNRRRPAR